MASYRDSELQMRYIECASPGGPQVMQIARRDKPTLRDGELLIEVAFAGVNRPDLMQRAGKYPPPKNASPILGLEVSGRVVAISTDSRAKESGFEIGDEVCALTPGGGYAEFVAVPVEQCLLKPKNLSLEVAAGIPENYFTVWANVFRIGELMRGESFLVHGGTSGIGTTAIQLAREFGATVYATAGTDEKCKACVDLGARAAINYKTLDFESELAEFTSQKGVDVILDMVGGSYTAKNLNTLARKGRLVQIATQQGAEVSVDLMKIMQKKLVVTGSTLRPLPIPEKAVIARDLKEKVWPLLEAGSVRPLIDRVFDLKDAPAAHTYLEGSTHLGKIVLRVRG